MDPTLAAATPIVLLATFGICVASGVLPFVNAELYLLAVSATLPPALMLPILLLATSGQMLAKAAIFLTGRGLLKVPGRWNGERLARVQERLGASRTGDGLIFVSASAGIPPFYLVSVASGVLTVGFMRFMVLGFAGRFLRFGAVLLVPQVGRALLS